MADVSDYVRLRWKIRLRKYLSSAVALGILLTLSASIVVGLREARAAVAARELLADGFASLSGTLLGRSIDVSSIGIIVAFALMLALARWSYVAFRVEHSPVIEVSVVEGQGVNASEVNTLADKLRRYLSEVSVGPPPAVPGGASATVLVDAVRTARVHRSEFAANVLSLVLNATSPVGYRLNAVFSVVNSTKSITTQFDALVHGKSEIHEYRGASWEEAIERAAHGTAALVIPLTYGARSDRWILNSVRSSDHGRFLLHQYLRAQRLEESRRLDEALQSYNNVLRGVPQGWSRIALGNMHSQLGNFVDALGNYMSAAESIERNPIARYRLAATLGYVEYLVQGWAPATVAKAGEERQRELDHLRRTLAPRLEQRYRYSLGSGFTSQDWEAFAQGEGSRMRDMFLAMSEDEFIGLGDDLGERRYRREWLSQSSADPDWPEITPADVALARYSSKVRRACILYSHGDHGFYRDLFKDRDVAQEIRKNIRKEDCRSWQNHYNAACTYAVAMNANILSESCASRCGCCKLDRTDQSQARLAQLAVQHLEEAVRLSGGSIIRTKRRWILRDDPDLSELRGNRHFESFRTRAFPALSYEDPEWEKDPLKRAARYASGLVLRAALDQSAVWRKRTRSVAKRSYDQAMLAEWARKDAAAWEHVFALAKNVDHWQTRLDFVEAFWPERNGYRDDLGLWSVATRYDRAIIRHYGLIRWPSDEDHDAEQRIFSISSVKVTTDHLARLKIAARRLSGKSEAWERYFGSRIAGGIRGLPKPVVRRLSGRATGNWVTLARMFNSSDLNAGLSELESALRATQDPPSRFDENPRFDAP